MRIHFVVLNYNTANDVVNLIDRCCRKEDEIRINIVDNASTDDSIVILRNLYSDNKLIRLYECPANMGFSRANNWGYEEAVAYGADLCIVCNSDMLIVQKDFFSLVEDELKNSKFGILSPDIRCKSDRNKVQKGHQSPAYPYENTKKYIQYHYKKNLLLLEHSVGIWRPFYYIKRIFYGFAGVYLQYITKHKYANWRLERHEGVPVHGGFLILSSDFLKKMDKLFYPETLFYGEEILLFNNAQKKKLKIVYSPEIYVEHLQGKATERVGISLEKEYFVKSNLVSSDLMILKEMMKGTGR